MSSPNKLNNFIPGELVDIGGFRLHALVCGQGFPVVIFEPALGGFAQQYARIQEGVAGFTRAFAYDRAGQGRSDPGPDPRIPADLINELRTLLGRLDLQPPYVLVGHSFGGLLTRIYAGLHPEEVAGMVLVDASHEDLYNSFPNMDRMVSQAAMGVRLQKLAFRLGLGKLLIRLSIGSVGKFLSGKDLDAFLEIMSQPHHQETMLAEYSQYRYYYGPQSVVPRQLGDIPLMVVTAGKSVSGPRKMGKLTADEMNALHQRLQKELMHLSPQGEQLIIPEATHLSILFRAEYVAQVVDAIRRVVERVREERRPDRVNKVE